MKISIQTGGVTDRFGVEKGYAMIRAAGFDAVDWNLDDHLEARDIYAGNYRGNVYEKPMEEILDFFAFEIGQQRKNGLTVTQAHAPFPFHLDKDPALFPYMQKVYEACIRVCAAADCKRIVIHGLCGADEDAVAEMNRKLYSGLIPVLKETGVQVCLENLFLRSPEGFRYGHCADPEKAAFWIDCLNEAAGQESFGLCLDTGHLNVLGIDPQAYISKLGTRIVALHLHDNDGLNDHHLAPGNGNFQWQRFCKALGCTGYRGDLNFETYNQLVKTSEDDRVPEQLRAIWAAGEKLRSYILKHQHGNY